MIKKFQIKDIDYGNAVIVQDENDERHMLLRCIERTSYLEFASNLKIAFDQVEAQTELWELDLINLTARKIGDDNDER